MLKLILCLDLNNGISKENLIPWKIQEDLAHFRSITLNHIVVMGRKTFEALKEPLPNRTNIVFSKNKNLEYPNVIVNDNILDIIELSKKKDVFIVGGKEITNLFFSYLDEIILTKIEKNYNCDLLLDLDLKNFICYHSKYFDGFNIKWYKKINSKLLYGTTMADQQLDILKSKIDLLSKQYNALPNLAIITFYDDFKTNSYIKAKMRIASLLSINIEIINIEKHLLPNLNKKIIELNQDNNIHGILIQHPFPSEINVNEICSLIDPKKDVDCFNPINLSKLWFFNENDNKILKPCTPNAIINILKYYKIEIAHKRVVIVGRSIIVGKPLYLLFMNENATVTICHSKTTELRDICLEADILVCAIGKANFFDDTYIKRNAIVIDVGVNKSFENNICGDVDINKAYEKARYITPVPKGVGPVTIIELFNNLLIAYESKMINK